MGKKWKVCVFSSNTEFCIILFCRAHTLACSAFVLKTASSQLRVQGHVFFFSNFYFFVVSSINPLSTLKDQTKQYFFQVLYRAVFMFSKDTGKARLHRKCLLKELDYKIIGVDKSKICKASWQYTESEKN